MAKRVRTGTRPAFMIGFGSLLALLFLPGIVTLRKMASVYLEIQQIQDSHKRTLQLLSEIERRVYLTSIIVREAMLDSSPSTADEYKSAISYEQEQIEQELAALREKTEDDSHVGLPRLDKELDGYFSAIQPVLEWTAAERAMRATYFLREQQRPRRQSVLKIADEITRLVDSSYAKQIARVHQSQTQFHTDIQRVIAVAFLIGVLIAGATIGRIGRLEDRAERNRAKTEKAEEELRSLSTKLMQAQEEERKTISRELHDEVGQVLTGLRMGLAGLEKLREDRDGFREQVARIKALADQAFRSVREIAIGLRPSVLDLGLVPAVQWQARQLSKYSGLRTAVQVEGDVEDIPEEYRTCVYRVIQECLTNAVRHASAGSVRIEIREQDRILDIAVRDDGRGFVRPDGKPGLGLIGMEERVRELGGSLKIESQPPAGTSITVRLALPKRAA